MLGLCLMLALCTGSTVVQRGAPELINMGWGVTYLVKILQISKQHLGSVLWVYEVSVIFRRVMEANRWVVVVFLAKGFEWKLWATLNWLFNFIFWFTTCIYYFNPIRFQLNLCKCFRFIPAKPQQSHSKTTKK